MRWRIATLAALIFGFAFLSSARQEPQGKLVESIDYLHIKVLLADPIIESSHGDLAHFVCQITVVHTDGTKYIQYPYDALVDKTRDEEVATAIVSSYRACGARLVEIILETRSQQRAFARSTVSANDLKKR